MKAKNKFRNRMSSTYRTYSNERIENTCDNSTSVIDGKTDKIVANVDVGGGPLGEFVVVNPNTNMVYVTNFGSNTTSAIDGITNKVVANISVGSGPLDVDVNPNTDMVYVVNSYDNAISFIDGKSFKNLSP